MDRRTLLKTIAAGTAASAAPWAAAQSLPDQPLRWIVPYPAGGGTDVLARTVAEAMRETLGQQVVIDNRPGASTNIGAQIVATAKPDGGTFMSADNAVLAFNEHLFSKLPFNPEKDFTYIGGISRFPLALVVHPAFEAQTLKDFIAYAKANPGKLNYASPGNGSPHHLAMEMFKLRTGTFITHIPYRGAGPALQDLIGGNVDMMFDGLGSSAAHIKGGRIKALMVSGTKRNPAFPDVPCAAEVGLPDYTVTTWYGLWAPKGTPADVQAKIVEEIRKLGSFDELKSIWANNGADYGGMTQQQFAAFVSGEVKRWSEVVKASGAKLD